jgi:predicted 3-demethylubiquinone-9 3-methyltransferase (glyoxalase superfamily)
LSDRFPDDRPSDGGKTERCGWLTDRFGISWQIVPTVLGEMLHDADPARAGRVMQALMQMTKLDIDALKKAYDGLVDSPECGIESDEHVQSPEVR